MGKHKDKTFTPIGDGTRAVNLDLLHRKIGEPDENGCCPWTGMKNNIGYPFIGFKKVDPMAKGRMMLATRALLMVKLGRAILPGHNANHTCHNRWCMNIDHLEEGTQTEKVHAMMEDNRRGLVLGGWVKGKYYPPKKQNRCYKYSEEQIQFCRTHSLKEIQERYNLTRYDAARISRGSRDGYKWLPFPEE